MKKIFSAFLLAIAIALNAQVTANRFFYELTFKPKNDSARIDKVMTALDITPEKSLFRDFTMIAQDSILKEKIETIKKSGNFADISKNMKMPKFSYKVIKTYPGMEVQYIESILNGFTPVQLMYKEKPDFKWNILNEKEKIGEYSTQKAQTEFGGRKWTAWFSTEIPFQDGPYKFNGLPGLIVKVEDSDKNYSWELKGNKKVPNFEELTQMEKLVPGGAAAKVTEVSREKFEKTFDDYKNDPFASFRSQMPAQVMDQKMPGSDKTIGEMIKEQEKRTKDFYNSNDNLIERTQPKAKK